MSIQKKPTPNQPLHTWTHVEPNTTLFTEQIANADFRENLHPSNLIDFAQYIQEHLSLAEQKSYYIELCAELAQDENNEDFKPTHRIASCMHMYFNDCVTHLVPLKYALDMGITYYADYLHPNEITECAKKFYNTLEPIHVIKYHKRYQEENNK